MHSSGAADKGPRDGEVAAHEEAMQAVLHKAAIARDETKFKVRLYDDGFINQIIAKSKLLQVVFKHVAVQPRHL